MRRAASANMGQVTRCDTRLKVDTFGKMSRISIEKV